MTTCTCQVGPGKFEGEDVATFVAWDVILHGCADEEIGRYAFVRFPLDVDDETRQAARDYGYCDACIDGLATLDDYGVCVWESDQGFVFSRWFTTEDDWNAGLKNAAADDAEEGDDE